MSHNSVDSFRTNRFSGANRESASCVGFVRKNAIFFDIRKSRVASRLSRKSQQTSSESSSAGCYPLNIRQDIHTYGAV